MTAFVIIMLILISSCVYMLYTETEDPIHVYYHEKKDVLYISTEECDDVYVGEL